VLARYSRQPWFVVQCSTCGFVYLRNPPTYEQLVSEFAWEKTRAIEKQHRNLVGRRGLANDSPHPVARIRPQVCPAHTGALIHQQNEPPGLRRRRQIRFGLKERPREAKCQQAQHQAPKRQEEKMLESTPFRKSRGSGEQEHQGAEWCMLAGGSSD